MAAPNPHQITVQDISDIQPPIDQPLSPSPSKEKLNGTPKNLPKTEISQTVIYHNAGIQKENTENTFDKQKTTTANARIPLDKPFNLEAEIGKLKISIPLSELAKHDEYRQQIQRSLQLPEVMDDVNVLDDTPELLFGLEVNEKINIQTCPTRLCQSTHT